MLARDHGILTDQPHDNGGTDEAMTPPEVFLSSIGACAAYYAEEYLNARGLPDDGLEVRISAQKGDVPTRLAKLCIEVTAPGLNERHRQGILRAVDACLLKNTLNKVPEIDVRIATCHSQEHVSAPV